MFFGSRQDVIDFVSYKARRGAAIDMVPSSFRFLSQRRTKEAAQRSAIDPTEGQNMAVGDGGRCKRRQALNGCRCSSSRMSGADALKLDYHHM